MRMPSESRLDQLREQAWDKGVVTGGGVDVAGGPIPRKPGYYGQPVVRPPVWTWEIPVYFFVGGLGGMSAVIALGAVLFHHLDVARTAMWVAAIASVLSPVLLILDLGRPHLFINMLRVFKPQSAMSMGAWILAGFGMCVVPGLIAFELHTFHAFTGAIDQVLRIAAGDFDLWLGNVWNAAWHLYRCADRRDRDSGVVFASHIATDSFRNGGIRFGCCVAGITRPSNRAAQRDRILCCRRRNRALDLVVA